MIIGPGVAGVQPPDLPFGRAGGAETRDAGPVPRLSTRAIYLPGRRLTSFAKRGGEGDETDLHQAP
jgi:hypothetical protein